MKKVLYTRGLGIAPCAPTVNVNSFKTHGIFHKAIENKVRVVHSIYLGVTGYNFPPKLIVFLSLKINFGLSKHCSCMMVVHR